MSHPTRRTSDFVLRTFTVIALALFAVSAGAATDHFGRVTFNGLPVPGATVTATQREQQVVTVTDQDGVFRLAAPVDGVWTVRVEMLGFAPATLEIAIVAGAPASAWELKMLPLSEMTAGLQHTPPAPSVGRVLPDPAAPGGSERARPTNGATANGATNAAPPSTGFQRAQVNPSAAGAAIVSEPTAAGDADRGAADGFLINGSVNNGAASPFAQLAAFGNNRRGGRSLYNGGVGALLGNSAWDARPFSFTGQDTAEAVVHRRADLAPVRRSAEDSGTCSGTVRMCSSAISGRRPQRHHAAGADADGARARRRLFADRATRSDVRCRSSIRPPACRLPAT